MLVVTVLYAPEVLASIEAEPLMPRSDSALSSALATPSQRHRYTIKPLVAVSVSAPRDVGANSPMTSRTSQKSMQSEPETFQCVDLRNSVPRATRVVCLLYGLVPRLSPGWAGAIYAPFETLKSHRTRRSGRWDWSIYPWMRLPGWSALGDSSPMMLVFLPGLDACMVTRT